MIDVVGVPAGGPDTAALALMRAADVIVGGERHLAMATRAGVRAELVAWPSPLRPALPGLVDSLAERRAVVLASGDPLVSGIGSTLVELLGAAAVRIHPAVSSVALARARMGWPAESAGTVTLVGRPLERLRRWLAPGTRLVVLSGGPQTAAEVAGLLCEAGLGATAMTVLSDLGTEAEARLDDTAEDWAYAEVPALNVLCLALATPVDPGPGLLASPAAGLPDDAYEHDGQLSKRDVRASALAHLRPTAGELLWDVGAGAGSVGIEWARLDPRNRTWAIERSPERADRIERNSASLGVPDQVRVVRADALDAVTGRSERGDLPTPDAVFIGGGATSAVVDACWAALRPGGRMVVHTVTLETEQALVRSWQRRGGELTRLAVETAEPIGRFTGWKPARPVVQWSAARTADPTPQPRENA